MPVGQKKGQADFSLPPPFLTSLLIKDFFLILQVKPSVRLLYPNGEFEPGVRYGGLSAELVFRLRITFGAAVIIVDFLHHGMVRSPIESSGAIMPVDRPMTPGPQFRSVPVRRTIMIPPLKF